MATNQSEDRSQIQRTEEVFEVTTDMNMGDGERGYILVDKGPGDVVEQFSAGTDTQIFTYETSITDPNVKWRDEDGGSGGDQVVATPSAGVLVEGPSTRYAIFNPWIGTINPQFLDSFALPYDCQITKVTLNLGRSDAWPNFAGNPGNRRYEISLGTMDASGTFVQLAPLGNPHFTIASVPPFVGVTNFVRSQDWESVQYDATGNSWNMSSGDKIMVRVVAVAVGVNSDRNLVTSIIFRGSFT